METTEITGGYRAGIMETNMETTGIIGDFRAVIMENRDYRDYRELWGLCRNDGEENGNYRDYRAK